MKELYQLHQWQLWQEELKSNIRLPTSLPPSPSKLQDDVLSELLSIGLHPEEEVLAKSGYRLDALVEMHGKKVGIEVDGPSHFVGSKPNGGTLLKHRQVNTLDEIPVISVPYWENQGGEQQYLRTLLGFKALNNTGNAEESFTCLTSKEEVWHTMSTKRF
ncbi:hypothetical protein ACHAW5_010367 [Stephanodiscus triporus]|uniref:RAP domain-containing protein n=1 Tax=Stephanodiscus triporus TaxID=2934178 RepID=A0ABD3NH94_9STRA